MQSFSSMSSSSWSDLPIDLLISIKDKLQPHQPFDLLSFRSVCSQWRSVVPAPTLLPRYEVDFDNNNNIIHFTKNNNGTGNDLFISLPSFSLSPITFLCSSNGWLGFKTGNNETLHLFDPISNHKLTFPPLYPKLLLRYKMLKPTGRNAYRLSLTKVVVSSSTRAGVAVAGIVEIFNRTKPLFPDRRFVFYKGQKWSILMERSKGIRDIAIAGDGRIFAIGDNWELYMLDERPPSIRLKRFKLWLPKQVLEPDTENDPTERRIYISCCAMERSGESDLKVYGSSWRYKSGGRWISLKINVAKLRGDDNNVDVACDAQWSYFVQSSFCRKNYFTPSLRKNHSRLKC